MTGAQSPELVTGVRLFSVVLAGLLWLSVALERPTELQLQVPVVPEHLPAGLAIASAPTATLQVTVTGPRILLLGLPLRRHSCRLDLAGAGAGTISYSGADCNLGLEKDVKVVRVAPTTLRLTLAKVEPGGERVKP